jgi:hypothetical protein
MPLCGQRMSRKSGHRFSDKDMRHYKSLDINSLATRAYPHAVHVEVRMRRGPPGNARLWTAALLTIGAQIAVALPAAAVRVAAPISLALAGVVAPYSPLLNARERRVIASLFDGNANFPASGRISVKVDSVVCRISNVDITARACELTFGAYRRGLDGRAANELYATLAAAGLTAEGAAGSLIESISKLDCTLDPSVIRQRAGGGAECSFETGP